MYAYINIYIYLYIYTYIYIYIYIDRYGVILDLILVVVIEANGPLVALQLCNDFAGAPPHVVEQHLRVCLTYLKVCPLRSETEHSGDTTPCRMTRVTLHSHVRNKEM